MDKFPATLLYRKILKHTHTHTHTHTTHAHTHTHSLVKSISSDEEFEYELRRTGEILVVVDFTADWWVVPPTFLETRIAGPCIKCT